MIDVDKASDEALDIILSELDSSKVKQIREGSCSLEDLTVSGDVVLKIVNKALSAIARGEHFRTNEDLSQEAYKEAMLRYPESHPALIFFSTAAGFHTGEVTDEALEWAKGVVNTKR